MRTILCILTLSLCACSSNGTGRSVGANGLEDGGVADGGGGNPLDDGGDGGVGGSEPGPALAFPGAEGFGATTRGAYALYEETGHQEDLPKIVHVRNLDDSGQGSLRAALELEQPRIIVFDIGGIINLDSPIESYNTSCLTIAGQTAPGDGICIHQQHLQFRSPHDIIIRGLRIRGPIGNSDTLGFRPVDADETDRSHHIIVDHCSLSWSKDEILSNYGRADHVTFSNNILDTPLLDHPYGSMIGPGSTYFTITKNLFVNVEYRVPLFGGGGDSFTQLVQGPTIVESINNIVYNARTWGALQIMRNPSYPGTQLQDVAVMGEYHKAGPDTDTDGDNYVFMVKAPGSGSSYVEDGSRLYFHGSLTPRRTSQAQDQWEVCSSDSCYAATRYDDWPFEPSVTSVVEASENYHRLIVVGNGMVEGVPRVGAYPRDTHDAQAIEDIASGSTPFQGTAGGWLSEPPPLQSYSSGTAVQDADQDGMPDDWEVSRNLDPNDPSDAHADRDGDGYHNIEEYINSFFEPVASESR